MENDKKIIFILLLVIIIFNLKMDKENLFPVKGAKITSGYGKRYLPQIGWHFHYGLDIISSKDLNIYAPVDSIVTFAGTAGSAGNMVKLSKEDFIFEFMHLDKILVKKDDAVKKGQKIGVMGSTGLSYGVHLHFGVMKKNVYINPLELIFKYE